VCVRGDGYIILGLNVVFQELFSAICCTRALANWRSNLLRRTPAQKDFRFTRAKRTGEAIGAKKMLTAVRDKSILKLSRITVKLRNTVSNLSSSSIDLLGFCFSKTQCATILPQNSD